MKTLIYTILLLFCVNISAQEYDGLLKLKDVSQNVFYSKNAESRAQTIASLVNGAEKYFTEKFEVTPTYEVFVLNPEDWKKFANPMAIYGIPHYVKNKLFVASEDNEFWDRNIPNLELLPKEYAEKFKKVYTNKEGKLSLLPVFDLISIHELGHAFQGAAKVNGQRNWLGETLCNLLLDTYIAEKKPDLLPVLNTFPEAVVKATDRSKLTFTSLSDFQNKYQEIAQKYPENYGWYQCNFHYEAAKIYNKGGEKAMMDLWNALKNQPEKLDDESLNKFLLQVNPAVADFVTNW